jgi:nucleotide-binding universal stress UspA family protein
MREDTSSPYRIVVGVDFGPHSEHAVREALRIGTRMNGTELHFTTVIEHTHLERAKEMAQGRVLLMYTERKLVSYVQEIADQTPLVPATVSLVFHVRIGEVVDTISQVGVDVDADLIVVGSSGRPRAIALLTGSAPERLLAEGRFPVLVARERLLEGLEPTEGPEPRRPGEELASSREDVLRSAERVDFGGRRTRISGLF